MFSVICTEVVLNPFISFLTLNRSNILFVSMLKIINLITLDQEPEAGHWEIVYTAHDR